MSNKCLTYKEVDVDLRINEMPTIKSKYYT